MSMIRDAKRVRFGQSLADVQLRVNQMIVEARTIKTNLVAMRAVLVGAPEFDDQDRTEFEEAITAMKAAVSAEARSLLGD